MTALRDLAAKSRHSDCLYVAQQQGSCDRGTDAKRIPVVLCRLTRNTETFDFTVRPLLAVALYQFYVGQ